ncbi:hypothetical protein EVAR_64093_1 [Eumeta japonica]|uniref:Uncharacterized protein n=1 Tax=Eumeta variegata TaxID=151549 RepID=A0A4C1ZIM2_EUMVA|nr:hypothetical protein EVAR_64093_1 [Eumeta japonica]
MIYFGATNRPGRSAAIPFKKDSRSDFDNGPVAEAVYLLRRAPPRRPRRAPEASSCRAVVYLRDVAANTIKGITFLLFSYISMPRSSTSRTKRETCPQRRAGRETGRRRSSRSGEQTRGAGAPRLLTCSRARSSPAGGKYYTVNEKFTHVSAPNAPVRPATPPVTLLDVGEDGVGDGASSSFSLNKQILPQPGA